MEVVTADEVVKARHAQNHTVEIHQLGEDEDEEEWTLADNESSEEDASTITDSDEDNNTWHTMVMQVSVAPEVAETDFEHSESPTSELEFFSEDGVRKTARVGAELSTEYREELRALFTKYEKIFVTDMAQLPQTNLATHKIKLKEGVKPVQQMLRRIKPQHMQAVKDEIQELLRAKCIFPVQFSDWVSPLVIVIKKNGKVRVCIDYGKLNKATEKDRYPIPFIDEILDEVAGHEFYSFCGYHQVAMELSDALKTTFVTPWGTFAYRVMPFGLSTAPATFQAIMTEALHTVIGKCLRVFFDDFAVHGTKNGHIGDLDSVFACLAKARLSLNPEKCFFAVRTGRMLGHVVDRHGIRVDPDKIDKMLTRAVPRDVTQLRSFCSAASYYR